MREILFRGKRISNGKWVYGGIVTSPHPNYDHPMVYAICSNMMDVFVDQDSIGQYTGLTDKNGKKIFEGDVIKFHKFRYEPDWVGVISYDQCQYVATGKMPLAYEKPKDGEAFYCPFEVALSGIDKATIKVIGNIHDNMELLKGGAS